MATDPGAKRRWGPLSHPDRALFRVEFPRGQRPKILWGGLAYDVLDISERGLRLSTEDRKPLLAGTAIRATVSFEDASDTIDGTVLRGSDLEAVLVLTEGFSLERIRREERRLIRAAHRPETGTP